MNKLVIRNIAIAALLILLLAAVLMFRDSSPFGKNQSNFAADPESEITRIEIASGNERLSLEKSGTEWKVNGKYEARKNTVAFLLDILKEMKIKSPVSPDIFKKEITDNNITPVKVKVYSKRKQISSFLVYPTSSNVYGNIMKRRMVAKPFIVSLPGLENDIGTVFSTDELFWRPYIVFNVLPSEISSLTFESVSDPASSFTIEGNSGRFNLFAGDSLLTGWDMPRLRRYLSYYTMVPFERWAKELNEDDRQKIEAGQPLYRISLSKRNGSRIYLTLWEKKLNGSELKDSDRLWAKTGDSNELFVIRYFDIDPLLKKRSYFFNQ